MLKRIAVVGGIVAVTGLGVGGAVSAWSGAPSAQAAAVPASAVAAGSTASTTTLSPSNTVSPSNPVSPSKTAGAGRKAGRGKGGKLFHRLGRVSHAQWVAKDGKTGTFVTHDAVRGQVTAIAPGSITIKAADGTVETYVVTGSTKIRAHGAQGAATLSRVKVGDTAAVTGTGTATRTATRIVDRGVPGSHRAGASGPSATAGSSARATDGAPTTSAAPTS